MDAALYDLSPVMRMLGVGLVLALGPILWVGVRHRSSSAMGRFQALTCVTLFLTFDLVLFGAFTRLSDSGLGCPDWPGCYGSASPVGAHAEIAAAQTAMPHGPVTHSKAWVEMVHRYFATGVGALTFVLMLWAWLDYWRGRLAKSQPSGWRLSPWWPTLTCVWTGVQGAFGALTVTMKLFPAIVSLHLLGGYILLGLLTAQVVLQAQHRQAAQALPSTRAYATQGQELPMWLKWGVCLGLLMLLVQVVSGAWVSTNYAVLACTDFPLCQGGWLPTMDFAQAFEIWRPLGMSGSGEYLSMAALTAIHFAHRSLAVLTVLVLGVLAYQAHAHLALRPAARWLGAILVLQLATGLSNVVLDWPLLAALLHTGGAGALCATLVWMLTLSAAAHTAPLGSWGQDPKGLLKPRVEE